MRANGNEGDPSERSVVQFATHLMYTGESEEQHPIIVMRVGCLETSCSVAYCTAPDEFAGIKYDAIEKTKLEFGPGESLKIIHLQLRENASYDNVVEAKILLDDPEHCTLGVELHMMRIKIIDNDVFPDNRFHEQISEDYTTDSWRHGQDLSMVLAFGKMAFLATMPGSWKVLLADQVDNLIYISSLAINKALITTLAASVDDDISHGWQLLLAYALGLSLPFMITHYLAYQRQFWKVGGGARKLLLNGLMQKYMYHQEASRDLVDTSEFKLTFSEDTFQLVDRGFMQLFVLVGHLGRIAMVFLFLIVLACFEFADHGDLLLIFALIPMFAVPPAMIFYVKMRAARAQQVREQVLDAKVSLVHLMNSCVEHIGMITSFFIRPLIMAQCHDRINVLNQRLVIDGARNANDMAFFGYVEKGVQFVVVFFGGLSVLYASTDLGTFTAAISALLGSSALYRKVYLCLKEIHTSYPCCWHVVEYMNHPTDLTHRQDLGHRNTVKFESRLRDLINATTPDEGEPVDRMDITVENVKFCYPGTSAPINWGSEGMSLSIGQGQLVAIMGPPAIGTKTVTRLLAGELLPTEGRVFVPPHLRVLRVAIRPVLWDGPLAVSLFWGLMGRQEYAGLTRLEDYRKLQREEIERGLRICRRLNIPEDLVQKIQEDIIGPDRPPEVPEQSTTHTVRETELKNHQVLASIPASARCKIQLACALIDDPPILVLDKPLQNLTIPDASNVMECLREYVDMKGLEKSEAHQHGRRPRTCIITTNSPMLLAGADEVLVIGEDGSVKTTFDTEKLMGEAEKLIHDEEADVVRVKSASRSLTRSLSRQWSAGRAGQPAVLDSPQSAPGMPRMISSGASGDHPPEECQSI